MGVYSGTGYFIPTEDLENISLAKLEKNYPEISTILLKDKTARSPKNLLSLLRLGGLATDKTICQYGEPVCFVGDFKKYFDEDDTAPDSGDAAMVERLRAEEGYDYAVSNDNEMTRSLETVSAILKDCGLIGPRDVLESYWFLMPWEG